MVSGAKGGKKSTAKSPKNLDSNLRSSFADHSRPIMEVQMTVKDESGGTTHIKGVSIAPEDELRSIKKTARDLDGKSSKSKSMYGKSMRSRKFGGN